VFLYELVLSAFSREKIKPSRLPLGSLGDYGKWLPQGNRIQLLFFPHPLGAPAAGPKAGQRAEGLAAPGLPLPCPAPGAVCPTALSPGKSLPASDNVCVLGVWAKKKSCVARIWLAWVLGASVTVPALSLWMLGSTSD